MINPRQSTSTRTSLLLSLILHMILVFVLAIVVLEPPRDDVAESLGVDIMRAATKRVNPPRRLERREAWSGIPDDRAPNKKQVRAQFERRSLDQVGVDFSQSSSSDTTVLPEINTNADHLEARIEMPLPRATGAGVEKPNSSTQGAGKSGGGGIGSVGLSPGAGIIETAMYWIGRNTVSQNETGREDMVFLIDASGSMEENIAAVARYLSKMIDVFRESDLDYTMGVIRFNRVLKKNDIKVYEQTEDAVRIRSILRSIKCDGDERTLDAIEVGLTQVEFREPSDKTFILVTDEAFTPRTSTRQTKRDLKGEKRLDFDLREITEMSREKGIKINILGIDDNRHKTLAKETGGLWFQIPQQDEFR